MRGLVLALVCAASLAEAGAPETSPLPPERPVDELASRSAGSVAGLAVALRPRARPAPVLTPAMRAEIPTMAVLAITAPGAGRFGRAVTAALDAALRPAPTAAAATLAYRTAPQVEPAPLGLTRSPRPEARGEIRRPQASLVKPARAIVTEPVRTRPRLFGGRKGTVCEDRRIEGRPVAPITGRLRGCGIADPVEVTAIDGVRLSQPSLMNCGTAIAIKDWIRNGVKPAVGRTGGGVEALRVAAHYSCRTRNHKPGAKLSEHGKGNAIDISAVRLKDGTVITVSDGWRQKGASTILRAMHASACGPFRTVLGPDADRYHQDHFHFDTAPHRRSMYCR